MKPAKKTLKVHAEQRESLWWLTVGPGLWAVHFVLSYATAAIWCAKAVGPSGTLGPVRIAIAIYTLVGIAGSLLMALRSWRRLQTVPDDVDDHLDTAASRHRFLAMASLLLTVLGAVGILYVAFVPLAVTTCR